MKVVHESDHNRFTAYTDDDGRMGELGYTHKEGKLWAMHTNVDHQYRGKGVAGELLSALVGYAEKDGQKIVPVCSYVADAFGRDPGRYRAVMDTE